MTLRALEPVSGSGGQYLINRLGQVWSVHSDRFLLGSRNAKGYISVTISTHGRKFVHRLVMETFVGHVDAGMHVDHINGVRDDNRLSNLRYCTPAENVRFSAERGAHPKGSANHMAKLDEAAAAEIIKAKLERGRMWGRVELARKFGVHVGQVSKVANGRLFKHVAVNPTTVHQPRSTRRERTDGKKLTPAEMLEIKAAKASGGRFWGATLYAKKFGVSTTCVRRVANDYDAAIAARSAKPGETR